MSEQWPVHTVVFDMDDTLFAERQFVRSGFEAVNSWLQKRDIDGFLSLAMHLFEEGQRGDIFDVVLQRLGACDQQLVPKLVQVYREHTPVLSLFQDAAEVIAWASGRFQLALISDGYLDVQRRKAAALGLEKSIPCLVFSDAWGREAWKPSERPFREVMAQCPGRPEGFIYVSDNPRKDFIAPRKLRWRTVRIRRSGGEHTGYIAQAHEAAEREIQALTELTRILVPPS